MVIFGQCSSDLQSYKHNMSGIQSVYSTTRFVEADCQIVISSDHDLITDWNEDVQYGCNHVFFSISIHPFIISINYLLI